MPSIASVMLTVNMPPVNSIITILPQRGNALFTQYTLRVTNSKDKDSPIQYRYAYYESYQQYQQDLLKGKQDNLIILQDFTPIQTLKTILESGNLTILISVSDSLGSIVNYTQQINSLSFYEQWQLDKDITTNESSKCKQMVSDLTYSDFQQLIIGSIELMKLLEQNISQDCINPIHQQLLKNYNLLFEQLLQSSNNLLKSRISNTLSKIYELNIGNAQRFLSSQQEQCYNESSNSIQITQLKQILNNVDSEQIINNISQIGIQIQKAIQLNNNLTQDSSITQDIGDDYTQRSLQQNIELRKSFIRILGSLFNKVYQQQIFISGLIDQLMDSFQSNLVLDASGISMQTQGLGIQIYKIGQKKFQNFIINNQYDPENLNLSNFIINRYVQLVKYKNNKYQYTEDFQNIFNNGSMLLYKKETNIYIYEKSIIPFESSMLDPQIYVDNTNQVSKVLKLYHGKLAFNMGLNVSKCDTAYEQTNQYQFVCLSYMNQKWVQDCQIELFTNKNGKINAKCYCDKLYPVTLMIMNISNITKTQNDTQMPIITVEDYFNILIANNITIHAIILIFVLILCLSLLYKIRKQKIDLHLIKEQLDKRKFDEPIGLTLQPRMSTRLFKSNIKYLHEITRLIMVDYIYINSTPRILLTSININLLLSSVHIFNIIIKNYILSVVISIFVQLIFQLVVKVLEGFFDGPKTLRVFGFIIKISLNIGIIFINIILNSSQQNYILQIIQMIISIAILYGPIELIIQYVKLNFAFTICEQLRLDPFNPVINLAYYFMKDEIVIALVNGAELQ